MTLFEAGTERLYILCLQIEASGFTKCPYEKPLCLGTTEITCWACPVTDRTSLGHSAVIPLDVTAPGLPTGVEEGDVGGDADGDVGDAEFIAREKP
jgi:hypothetical protein